MAQAKVLGKSGDITALWDPVKVAEGDPEAITAVQQAERIVQEAAARGGAIFTIDPATKEGSRIPAFDPRAEELLVVLPLAGG